MALVTLYGYFRISHVKFDERTMSGEVKVEQFVSKEERYAVGESPRFKWYPVSWVRDAYLVSDAYAQLALHMDFIGAEGDTEELPESNGGTLVVSPRPSEFHFLIEGVWAVDLALLKNKQKYLIKTARDEAESAGFEAYGVLFDSDVQAVKRIGVTATAALVAITNGDNFTKEWTLADNTTTLLTAAQIAQLPVFMAIAGDAIHAKARGLKAQIDAATTVEEIVAVVW